MTHVSVFGVYIRAGSAVNEHAHKDSRYGIGRRIRNGAACVSKYSAAGDAFIRGRIGKADSADEFWFSWRRTARRSVFSIRSVIEGIGADGVWSRQPNPGYWRAELAGLRPVRCSSKG